LLSMQLVSLTKVGLGHEQLRNIIEITKNWNDHWRRYAAEETTWFRGHQANWHEPGPRTIFLHFNQVVTTDWPPGRLYWAIQLQDSGHQLITSHARSEEQQQVIAERTAGGRDFTILTPPPSGLAEFRDFWNQDRPRFRIVLPNQPYCYHLRKERIQPSCLLGR